MAIGKISPVADQLNSALKKQNESIKRLSSGKRINSAADDPAGLAIADGLKSVIDTLGQASRNVADVGSVIQIQDGALEQVGNISSRLKELATQASNGTLSDTQRGALQQEFSALTQEAQRITGSTQFNGQNVLDGSDLTAQVGTGADSDSQIVVPGADISGAIANVASQNIGTQQGAQDALAAIDSFTTAVSSSRGELGGSAARLEFAGNNIAVEKENAAAAEARIRDADIADELSKKVSSDILVQVNTALNAQSKLSAQSVLKLLS